MAEKHLKMKLRECIKFYAESVSGYRVFLQQQFCPLVLFPHCLPGAGGGGMILQK